MTRDNIIRMAREADLVTWGFESLAWEPVASMEAIERFAQLVTAAAAASEREACMRLCEEIASDDNPYGHDECQGACECLAAIQSRGIK